MKKTPPEILALLSAKLDALKQKGIEPKALLLSAEDYSTLNDELKKNGITGNPDRLRLTPAGKSYPLYSTDASKTSERAGDIKTPMVIL